MRASHVTRGRAGRRGAAILELAISLPLFLLILSGTYYFFDRYHDRLAVQLAARYAAWHAANGSSGGSTADELASKFGLVGRGQLELASDGCTQSVVGRLGSGPDSGPDGDCGLTSGSGGALEGLGGAIGGFFRDKGIDFSLHGRTVRLRTQTTFMAPAEGAVRSTVGVCWVHDNYVPGASVEHDEVKDTFGIEFTREAPLP